MGRATGLFYSPAGLPVGHVFFLAFELTPEGIKKEKHVAPSESVTHATGQKLNSTIIGVLAVAVVFFAVDKFILSSGSTLPTEMSSDPEQEFFSDGLSEEILNLLAKVPDLKVIGRTSSFAFKGKNEDLRVIGEKLDVSAVLEGSGSQRCRGCPE